jgi:cell volume regulation protein A
VVVSVAVQGPTIPVLARRLGLADERTSGAVAELLPLDSLEADVVELELTGAATVVGSPLRSVPLPSKARVAAVVRDERTFVPDGDTVLVAGDRLLVVVPPDTRIDDLVDWAG